MTSIGGPSGRIPRGGIALAVPLVLLAFSSGCSRSPSLPKLSPADSAAIVRENLEHRIELDTFFRSDPGSPFKRDTTVAYHGIRWFPIDPRFRARSTLHRYEHADTVVVLGTRGEWRHQLRYGYFEFAVPGNDGRAKMLRLNVYKFTPYDGQRYYLYKEHLSVWFTDSTTGNETYNVGRYVDVGDEHPDPSYEYTIDLNMAYNPYCAYTPLYSCAVPRQDDRLDIALRVGEMKYHE